MRMPHSRSSGIAARRCPCWCLPVGKSGSKPGQQHCAPGRPGPRPRGRSERRCPRRTQVPTATATEPVATLVVGRSLRPFAARVRGPQTDSVGGFQHAQAHRIGLAMDAIEFFQPDWTRRPVVEVKAHRIARFVGAALVVTWPVLTAAPVPSASADPCPDVEAMFARGTGEPPGVGGVGQAFVDALRSQVGGRSMGVYPINYEASADFGAGMDFALTVVGGIRDASGHIESMTANCPNTRMVLGGFSQGAVVSGFVTSAVVPDGVPVALVPAPMPPEVAKHVAAVALFGKPSDEFMRDVGAPPIVIGPLYVPKTIDLCAPGDTICDGAPVGPPGPAHAAYPANGMVGQAATFAANRL
jgi:cutinase